MVLHQFWVETLISDIFSGKSSNRDAISRVPSAAITEIGHKAAVTVN